MGLLPLKAFQALLPGEGDVDFVRYLNSETGAHAYSELEADAQFFASRGYVANGVAWSI